jgi:hypothetical protein
MLAWLLLAAAGDPAAVEVRRLPAPEAHQGVAADARSVYAIDNSQVARYDKTSGRRLALWQGDPKRFKHLNSCIVRARQLVCAASNYPDVPMASMVVWLDAATLKLRRVRPLPKGPGSLTWLDWHDGSWWAGYANYDGKGGEPGRDHRQTAVVRYDARFTPRATYRFPDTVLARFAPRSTSGGAWGKDGLLYVTGHDHSTRCGCRDQAPCWNMSQLSQRRLVARQSDGTGANRDCFGRSSVRPPSSSRAGYRSFPEPSKAPHRFRSPIPCVTMPLKPLTVPRQSRSDSQQSISRDRRESRHERERAPNQHILMEQTGIGAGY